MRFNTILCSVVDRTHGHIVFEFLECLLDFSQLNVERPEPSVNASAEATVGFESAPAMVIFTRFAARPALGQYIEMVLVEVPCRASTIGAIVVVAAVISILSVDFA